jgi:hypothetical protein
MEYPRISFEIDGFPAFCGAEVICHPEEDGDPHWGADEKVFKTRKGQLDDFYKRIGKSRETRQLVISLVTAYAPGQYNGGKTEQFKELREFLQNEKKWKVYEHFVNPNHGNKVIMMGKVFPAKKEVKLPPGIFVRY